VINTALCLLLFLLLHDGVRDYCPVVGCAFVISLYFFLQNTAELLSGWRSKPSCNQKMQLSFIEVRALHENNLVTNSVIGAMPKEG
jgi:hypothetical protein